MPEALQKVNIGLQHEMQHKKVLENQGLFWIGVAGFELATSASLRRRSNQAEPHPGTKIIIA